MISNIDVAKVLFLDIETVSEKASYEELDDTFQSLWKLKCRAITRNYEEEISDEEASVIYKEKAGIYAEFGKIVCISVGIITRNEFSQELNVRLKSFAYEDESKLLAEFCRMVEQYYNNPNEHYFCGHNIKEFDIPYICRRLVVNQLKIPFALDLFGKKPWETKHLLDTMVFWKFGDYKNYTSLKLLAAVLGFPSPKDDIDGSEVGPTFWENGDLDRIADYCEKDVLAVVQLLLRYKRMPLLEAPQVVHIK